MRRRNRHISVWLTDLEHQNLREQAARTGLGIDPLIRTLIQGVQLRPRPPDEYAALLRELSAIGNNINQIAHLANGKKDISQQEVAEAVRLVHRAWRLVRETL